MFDMIFGFSWLFGKTGFVLNKAIGNGYSWILICNYNYCDCNCNYPSSVKWFWNFQLDATLVFQPFQVSNIPSLNNKFQFQSFTRKTVLLICPRLQWKRYFLEGTWGQKTNLTPDKGLKTDSTGDDSKFTKL